MREGWKKITLGEIVELGKGGSWGQDDQSADLIQAVCLRGTDLAELIDRRIPDAPVRWIKESELKKSKCSKDMVLIETSGSKCGRSIVLTDEILVKFDLPVIYSNFCRTLTIDTKTVTREFVEIWFSYNYANGLIPSYRATSAMPNLDVKALLRVESIKVPPLTEQRRLVDLISSLDSYIESLEKQLGTAKSSRSAILDVLLSSSKDDWEVTSLGNISKCAGGCAFPDAFQGNQEGIPFIKVSDMNSPGNEKYIGSANNFVTPEVVDKLRLRIWDTGTVIFPKVGAALITEKRRILTTKTIFDNNIMGLVPNEKILSEFLYLLMLNIRFSDYVQPGAVPSIKNTIVEEITVKVPSIVEQLRIVSIMLEWDNFINTIYKTINEVRNVRSGLLSELLSGEHEIPASYDKVMSVA